jgi:hypothetical protein
MYILERDWYDASSYIEHLTHHIDPSLIVAPADIDECGEEDIADLIAPDHSLLSLKAIFEQFSNHICVFSECSDSATHISWWEDAVFIPYGASRPSVIGDRDDSRDGILWIALDAVEDIECPSSTSYSDYIDRHT